ncbi:MAG: sugar phosphate isomerase/epimerase [Spirochaetales bacterium]|nr:MAG: sugar phosphate isomerase/epimerase [Spirochaetales bacterium]
MKVGCFALIEAWQDLEAQLKIIADLGFSCADITDSHSGASLIGMIHANASLSLDENPISVKKLFAKYGLEITTVCAHGNLLDPSTPSRYGTNEMLKAIKMAALISVPYVVTTDGTPDTKWGMNLSFAEKVLVIADKIYEPVKLAGDLGVTLLLEPHGPVTDTIDGLEAVMNKLGNPDSLGINMDTGNSWLGGADVVKMAKTFKDKIKHVHWKDLPKDWEERRGKEFGTGMSPIALGEGIIDIASVYSILKHVTHSTLEVGGKDNLLNSYKYLKSLGAE